MHVATSHHFDVAEQVDAITIAGQRQATCRGHLDVVNARRAVADVFHLDGQVHPVECPVPGIANETAHAVVIDTTAQLDLAISVNKSCQRHAAGIAFPATDNDAPIVPAADMQKANGAA